MIAIWPVGPPKLMNPSFTQNRSASAKGTSGTVRPVSGGPIAGRYRRPPGGRRSAGPDRASAGVCRGLRYHRGVGTDRLVIHGAREHNLKNVTLDLPRNQLIVFTG